MVVPHVSIPIGFSHQLRHLPGGEGRDLPVRFNPYRVFSSAETALPAADPLPEHDVSIPIGFSHQLRRMPGKGACPQRGGFNPYRVFSSAETRGGGMMSGTKRWFQFLSGFLIS